MTDSRHEELAQELADASTVMLLGGMDTGKTTLAHRIARNAAATGKVVGLVDADIDNSSIGPPTCVGMRLIRRPEDLEQIAAADSLHFVGTTSPSRLVLQQVIATASMVESARQAGADLVLIDSNATVSGVAGETLKYHKMELCRPDRVLALQRGSELEPLVGMLSRFFSVEIDILPVDPETAVSGSSRATGACSRLRLEQPRDAKATEAAPTRGPRSRPTKNVWRGGSSRATGACSRLRLAQPRDGLPNRLRPGARASKSPDH
jgi:polynucleotide 5'-kinase involved in rRNA processing